MGEVDVDRVEETKNSETVGNAVDNNGLACFGELEEHHAEEEAVRG